MYAQLCKRLSNEAPNFDDATSKDSTFVRLLRYVCREKFYNRSNTTLNGGGLEDREDTLTTEEEEKLHVAKQRMLGNVKFIGELSKLHIISETILHTCIRQLLDENQKRSSIQDRCEDMECLSELIRTCGKKLDTEQGKQLMDQYFEKMDRRSKSTKYPARIRFMLKDVIELRENNWLPRKMGTAEGPVPIRQIRTDDDSLIRTQYVNRNRDMRNNDRENDNWNYINRFPLSLQSGMNDVFGSLSVPSSSPILSPNYNNNNRQYNNQRNNQNNHHNYNNRFNKHNNQHNNSQHNSHSQSSQFSSMLGNKDMGPRFKRNLMTPNQESVDNLEMRPGANSLLFKANMNIKTPPMLPISTPPPGSAISNSTTTGGLSQSQVLTPNNYPLINTPTNHILQPNRPNSTPSAEYSEHRQNLAKSSLNNSQNHSAAIINHSSTFKSTSSSPNLTASTDVAAAATPANNQSNNKSAPNDIAASTNDMALITKQGSSEKPTAKQNKKEKGLNKEEMLKKVGAFVASNLIVATDAESVDIILTNFNEMKVPDKLMKDTCIVILNDILESADVQYDLTVELLQQLRKKNKLPANALLEAFKQIINRMVEKEIAIPKITTLVANLLARAVSAKLCKLSDISQYTENGQHYPLFLLVLQQLHKSLGRDPLEDMFRASKVDLMKSLPEADRNKNRMAEILEDRNLTFLYPLLKVQSEMMSELHSEKNPQSFYKWIKTNVDAKYYTDAGFITALVTVLLKFITEETTLAEGTDVAVPPEKALIEKEEALLHKYCQIMETFLNGSIDLQLVAVYALQVFCYNANFPKGMMCRWFKNLYEANVIEEDALLRWKEEVTDEYPGKGKALFQVNQWLTWLEEAESEDEED